jgi:hypothetical protein
MPRGGFTLCLSDGAVNLDNKRPSLVSEHDTGRFIAQNFERYTEGQHRGIADISVLVAVSVNTEAETAMDWGFCDIGGPVGT